MRDIGYDIVIGVDISLTDTGIVVVKPFSQKWEATKFVSTKIFAKKPEIDREHEIALTVRNIVNEYKFGSRIGVVIEDHAFGRNTGKAKTRAELTGIIKYLLLRECGVDVYLVSPTSLKKFMDCSDKKSRSDKDAMFQAASRKFQFVHTNNNIVDAYCLARYLIANREGQKLIIIKHKNRRAVQVSALRKVLKPTKIGD